MTNAERLENLKRLKVEEEMSSEPSKKYIADLILSIEMYEGKVSSGKPNGYEMVKG